MAAAQVAVVRLRVNAAAPMLFEIAQQDAVMCVHVRSSVPEISFGASAGLRVDFCETRVAFGRLVRTSSCRSPKARSLRRLKKDSSRGSLAPSTLLPIRSRKNSAGPKFCKTGWFGAWREVYEVQVPECARRRAMQRIQCALEIDAIRHTG